MIKNIFKKYPLELFCFLEIVFQLCALIELGKLRAFVRIMSFGVSLFYLAYFISKPSIQVSHPGKRIALFIFGVLFSSFLHPATDIFAGFAQMGMYVAVLAPLFWVPKIAIDTTVFKRILLILWVFYTVSSFSGFLQVYFPRYFQPTVSSIISEQGAEYLQDLEITLANGRTIFRPMGLSNIPGGVAMPSFYTIFFGLGFFLLSTKRLLKIFCLLSFVVAFLNFYFAQVRAYLVVLVLCVCFLVFLFSIRLKIISAAKALLVLSLCLVCSYGWVLKFGGVHLMEKYSGLASSEVVNVYYGSRGVFLSDLFRDILPKHLLGAGLGRWGMMQYYFGRSGSPLYAEIQLTGWVLDGGFPLFLCYLCLIAVNLFFLWKASRACYRAGLHDLYVWSAIMLAYSVGISALIFNSPFFSSQQAIEYWLLSAAFWAVVRKNKLVQ